MTKKCKGRKGSWIDLIKLMYILILLLGFLVYSCVLFRHTIKYEVRYEIKNTCRLRSDNGDWRNYFLPDEIVDIYYQIIETDPSPASSKCITMAGYILDEFPEEKKEDFWKQLKKLGYKDEEIVIAHTILTGQGNIILKESTLNERGLEGYLLHELAHRETDRLDDKEKQAIEGIQKEFQSMKYWQRFMKRENQCVTQAIDMNWDEFIPYLTDGTLPSIIEETLKTNFPHIYAIVERIKIKAKNSELVLFNCSFQNK